MIFDKWFPMIIGRSECPFITEIQTPDKKSNSATIVIITHKTNENSSKNCLSMFRKNKNILKYPTLIRLFD